MKIPLEYEDTVDNKFCGWSDQLSPHFKKLNFTPNMITTLALFCTIAIIYFILQNKCGIAAGFYLLAYFFDCMDGLYARKYEMTSKYGDYYEHIVDWIRNISVLIMIFYSCSCDSSIVPIVIIIILFILGNIKQAYQDKYYKLRTGRDETESLNFLEKIVAPPDNIEDIDNGLKKLKYVGWGTFTLVVAVVLGSKCDVNVDAIKNNVSGFFGKFIK